MIKKLHSVVEKLSLKYLLILMPFILIMRIVVNTQLDKLYAKSLFPVPFFQGQMTFNASELTGYYKYMIEHNTLDVYLQTQLFDYVFIAATILLHGVTGLVLWKLHLNNRLNRRLAVWIFVAGLAAPIFDALENLVSFIFIANTAYLNNPLTILYSTFAACKFACYGLTYLGVMVSIINWIWIKSMKRTKPESKRNSLV